MIKKENQEVDGKVTESLPNAMFRVELSDGRKVLAKLAGKMRLYRIRVIPGDQVRVEMTPYDDSRGRIIYRF